MLESSNTFCAKRQLYCVSEQQKQLCQCSNFFFQNVQTEAKNPEIGRYLPTYTKPSCAII